jgi:hypothetical protein
MSALGLALPDVLVTREGGIFLVQPVSRTAREWVEENVYDPMYWGDAVVAEGRYVYELVDGMLDAGLVVR